MPSECNQSLTRFSLHVGANALVHAVKHMWSSSGPTTSPLTKLVAIALIEPPSVPAPECPFMMKASSQSGKGLAAAL